MTILEMTRPNDQAKRDPLALVTDEVVAAFQRDGAVWIEGLLAPAWMRLIEQGVKRNVKSPGPLAKTHFAGEEGAYFDDYCNYGVNTEYQRLLADSPIADVMAKVLKTEKLWLYCDQIFVKEGYSLPTRWHQDIPWWLADGPKMATMWIALDPLPSQYTLEYIPGSWASPVYNHLKGGLGEILPPSDAPVVPDIEADRGKWPIVSRDCTPGDVLIFHPQTLHGGGGMCPGGQRRSLVLRFFGEGTRYVERELAPDPEFPGVSEALRPGDLLRHPWFPQVYPRPKGGSHE